MTEEQIEAASERLLEQRREQGFGALSPEAAAEAAAILAPGHRRWLEEQASKTNNDTSSPEEAA